MADNGIIIIGNLTTGYTERETYVYWDVAPNTLDERTMALAEPYYLEWTAVYSAINYILTIYTTRWTCMDYTPTPMSEITTYLCYSELAWDERTCYFYLDTRDRWAFVEGLFTNTPLLMKYPKYYNWSYVPQVLNPQFILWSYYPLATNDITVKLMSVAGASVIVNSGTDASKFTLTPIGNNLYQIDVNVEHTFNTGDQVTCYITAYDTKGNYLKPGMW